MARTTGTTVGRHQVRHRIGEHGTTTKQYSSLMRRTRQTGAMERMEQAVRSASHPPLPMQVGQWNAM